MYVSSDFRDEIYDGEYLIYPSINIGSSISSNSRSTALQGYNLFNIIHITDTSQNKDHIQFNILYTIPRQDVNIYHITTLILSS